MNPVYRCIYLLFGSDYFFSDEFHSKLINREKNIEYFEFIRFTHQDKFQEKSDNLKELIHSISQDLSSDYQINKSDQTELSFILNDVDGNKIRVILRIGNEQLNEKMKQFRSDQFVDFYIYLNPVQEYIDPAKAEYISQMR